ncbi:MAG: HEAT repeat domain-containing protein [Gammaproteobacteria bacterium]
MIALLLIIAASTYVLLPNEPGNRSQSVERPADKLQTHAGSNAASVSGSRLERRSKERMSHHEFGFSAAEVSEQPEFIAPFIDVADTGERIERLQKLIGNAQEPQAIRETLYAAAHDPDAFIRERAYEQLREQQDAQLETILRDAANSSSIDFRLTAVGFAARFSVPYAVEILWQATEDSHVDVRYAAFQGLAAMPRNQGLPLIRDRLNHSDPAVRLLAIETMVGLGGAPADEAFSFASDDDDESIRNWAQERGSL